MRGGSTKGVKYDLTTDSIEYELNCRKDYEKRNSLISLDEIIDYVTDDANNDDVISNWGTEVDLKQVPP